ncbi:MAG: FAD-dependent oxidoreductase [Candidatus Omnitrophica bacterium]|nr:FAD-dependent oxidoreductase [Candidatus Omnitrophota bacterium]
MSEQESVLIIGCGIFGITAALELHRRGYFVTVVDPGPLPTPHASSTDISKAVRNDYGDDEIYVSMMDAAFEGWSEWNARWGIELFHRTGMLFMTRDEMRPGGFEYESYQFLPERGKTLERICSEDLEKKFPKWNHAKYVDGYLNPLGGWTKSGAVVARLIQEARDEGIEIREGFMTNSIELGDLVRFGNGFARTPQGDALGIG